MLITTTTCGSTTTCLVLWIWIWSVVCWWSRGGDGRRRRRGKSENQGLVHDDVQWTELGAHGVPTQIKPGFLFGNRIQVLDNFIRSWFLVGGHQVGHLSSINRYQHIPTRDPMVLVLPGVDRLHHNPPGRFVDRKITAYGVRRRHGHTIIPASLVLTPALLLLLLVPAVLLVLIPLVVPVRSVAVTVLVLAIAIVIVRLIIIPDDRRNEFIFIIGGGCQRLLIRVVIIIDLLRLVLLVRKRLGD